MAIKIMSAALEQNLGGYHLELKGMILDDENDIFSKTRRQRMVAYQLLLASALNGLFTPDNRPVDRSLTYSLMSDEFVSRFSAIGWGLAPYKP